MELQKLQQGKTKVDLTISNFKKDKYRSGNEEALDIVFQATLLKGCSINSLNQILEERLTDYEFSEIKYAKERIENILEELKVTIALEDKNIKVINHKFF